MKISVFFFLAIILILDCSVVVAQPYIPSKGKIYNDSVVPRIDILIDPDSLLAMMNNIFVKHTYPATFIFYNAGTTDTVYDAGVGLRGNTSLSSAKKSFEVAFNAFIAGNKYNGVEKLHLNGEHNDPSICRAKLYWESARGNRIPGPRANHVELYINGSYRGLYINVEHIDENLMFSRFNNNNGNLYKCLWPADLKYISQNPNDYKLMSGSRRVYDLKTNESKDDYTDLRDFIVALNNNPGPFYEDSLEKIFNVNAFLRCYALDVLTGNWDNYAGNKNNYYLYHNPQTNKMDYLPYDTDNTYGIDWFGIDWATRNCYTWELDSANKPLITRLFSFQDYRDRFSYFMNKMMLSFCNADSLTAYTDTLKNKIAPYVVNDTYHTFDYGYTYNDFLNSYTLPLGGHVPRGLYDYMFVRQTSALSQLVLNNVAPVFSETRYLPYSPHNDDTVFIKSWVEDELPVTNVYLHYKINFNGPLDSILMYDDGNHGDDLPADNIYGMYIEPQTTGDTIYYYLTNTDITGTTGREPRSGFSAISITPLPQLFVNEWMANNVNSVTDNFGEHEDFFEIYNDAAEYNLSHIFVSDDSTKLGKWNIGNSNILSKAFLLCWADNQTQQGDNHANFKLSANGESIFISEYSGLKYRILDSVSFGAMPADISLGCYPDGTKPIITQPGVTAGFSNLAASMGYNTVGQLLLYPNPVRDLLTLDMQISEGLYDMYITDVLGKVQLQRNILSQNNSHSFIIDIQHLEPGVYFLVVRSSNTEQRHAFVKQ